MFTRPSPAALSFRAIEENSTPFVVRLMSFTPVAFMEETISKMSSLRRGSPPVMRTFFRPCFFAVRTKRAISSGARRSERAKRVSLRSGEQ